MMSSMMHLPIVGQAGGSKVRPRDRSRHEHSSWAQQYSNPVWKSIAIKNNQIQTNLFKSKTRKQTKTSGTGKVALCLPAKPGMREVSKSQDCLEVIEEASQALSSSDSCLRSRGGRVDGTMVSGSAGVLGSRSTSSQNSLNNSLASCHSLESLNSSGTSRFSSSSLSPRHHFAARFEDEEENTFDEVFLTSSDRSTTVSSVNSLSQIDYKPKACKPAVAKNVNSSGPITVRIISPTHDCEKQTVYKPLNNPPQETGILPFKPRLSFYWLSLHYKVLNEKSFHVKISQTGLHPSELSKYKSSKLAARVVFGRQSVTLTLVQSRSDFSFKTKECLFKIKNMAASRQTSMHVELILVKRLWRKKLLASWPIDISDCSSIAKTEWRKYCRE